MNGADSTPLAAGGNGLNREDSGREGLRASKTANRDSSVDPGIRQRAPKTEHNEADGNNHQQMVARLGECSTADGGGEEHDAVAR